MNKIYTCNEKGQAMLETLLSMLFICLLFFGLLQIFHLAVAQMLTDYAGWSATRSAAVGFDEYLIRRSAQVATIGASGKITRTGSSSSSYENNQRSQYYFEKARIPYYLSGQLYLEYDHWNTHDENSQADGKKDDNTQLNVRVSKGATDVNVKVKFQEYPLLFLTGSSKETRDGDPTGGTFYMTGDWTDITAGEDDSGVTLRNYYSTFLE
jgi:hypothetical protein